MAESIAIGEIVDTDQIRVQLYQSGRPVHTPLQDMVDVAAGVPIYESVVVASGSRIKARVRDIRVQFYAPNFANPNTLVGGGYWTRKSKADIDAAGYPALAQFRSIDRFMPDGSTDATNGGYWVLNDDEPTPQMLGLFNEAVIATDQTATLQAWFDLCGILGVPAKVKKAARIQTMDTVTLPSNIDIDTTPLLIRYDGPRDRRVLDMQTSTNKTLRFGVVQGQSVDASSWSNDAYCGIHLQNVNNCRIWLTYTRFFAVGYRLAADTGESCGYNNIWPGLVEDNKQGEQLIVLGTGGWVNENTFHDGKYEMRSGTLGLGVARGTHITRAAGLGSVSINNNRWDNATYELGGNAGVNRTAVFFDGSGSFCTWADGRAESCFGPLVLCNGPDVRKNRVGFSFTSTSVAGQLNTIQEVNGANGNILTGNVAQEVRVTFNNLHRLLSSYGGANSPYLRGNLFLMSNASGSALRTTSVANTVRSNAKGLDLNACGVFVAVDTSRIKQWRYIAGPTSTGTTRRLVTKAFDSAGVLLTGNATSIYGTAWAPLTDYPLAAEAGDIVENGGNIYRLDTPGTSAGAGGPTGTGTNIVDGTCIWDFFGTDKYIKTENASFAATANYGGSYHATGFTDDLISVRPEVATMWIGMADSATGSIELIGYATEETLDGSGGKTSLIAFVPLDDDGSERLATANPGTAGTHGQYSVGQTVYNAAAASLAPSGWQCTTAGWLAAAWTISTAYSIPGRIVINGGNAYKLVTAGTSAGAGGPTGTGTGIVDGTCVWDFAGVQAVFTALPALP